MKGGIDELVEYATSRRQKKQHSKDAHDLVSQRGLRQSDDLKRGSIPLPSSLSDSEEHSGDAGSGLDSAAWKTESPTAAGDPGFQAGMGSSDRASPTVFASSLASNPNFAPVKRRSTRIRSRMHEHASGYGGSAKGSRGKRKQEESEEESEAQEHPRDEAPPKKAIREHLSSHASSPPAEEVASELIGKDTGKVGSSSRRARKKRPVFVPFRELSEGGQQGQGASTEKPTPSASTSGTGAQRHEQQSGPQIRGDSLFAQAMAAQVRTLLDIYYSPMMKFAGLVASQAHYPVSELILGLTPQQKAMEAVYRGEVPVVKGTPNKEMSLYLASQLLIPVRASSSLVEQAQNELRRYGGEMDTSSIQSLHQQRVRAASYDTVWRSPLFSELYNEHNLLLMTPMFYGHVQTATSDLQQINPEFRMQDLMFTPCVQAHFGKYVAALIKNAGASSGMMGSHESRRLAGGDTVYRPSARWLLTVNTNTIKEGRIFFRRVGYCGGKLTVLHSQRMNGPFATSAAIRGVFRYAMQSSRPMSTQQMLFPLINN